MTLGYIIIGIDLASVEPIPEDLRRKIAQHMDDEFMRIACGGRAPPPPTTLYVDKYGNRSTVDPREQARLRDRNTAFGGLIVSS